MQRLFWCIVLSLIALATCTEGAEDWNKKARRAFMANKREEAVQCYRRALTLDPHNEEGHYYLGWLYKHEGNIEESMVEFKKAIAINPNHELSHSQLGDLYLLQGRRDDAILEWQNAITIKPDFAEVHYSLGIAFRDKGDLATAADHLFNAGLLAVTSNNEKLSSNACNELKAMGNHQLAEELRAVMIPWFDDQGGGVRQRE